MSIRRMSGRPAVTLGTPVPSSTVLDDGVSLAILRRHFLPMGRTFVLISVAIIGLLPLRTIARVMSFFSAVVTCHILSSVGAGHVVQLLLQRVDFRFQRRGQGFKLGEKSGWGVTCVLGRSSSPPVTVDKRLVLGVGFREQIAK